VGSPFALLGLAKRAGMLEHGTESTRRAVIDGRACLVLLARDAAVGQQNKVKKLLSHRTTPNATLGTRLELGKAVGTAPVSAVAVTDEGFARRLVSQIQPDSRSAVVQRSGGS
jgi:ribosomal protein L7Ae-like RNA K-turn-binding protein